MTVTNPVRCAVTWRPGRRRSPHSLVPGGPARVTRARWTGPLDGLPRADRRIRPGGRRRVPPRPRGGLRARGQADPSAPLARRCPWPVLGSWATVLPRPACSAPIITARTAAESCRGGTAVRGTAVRLAGRDQSGNPA